MSLDAAIATIVDSLRSGGTLYACGNGGSDAHAGHLVAELVGRFAYDRPPLRAVHLSSGGPAGSCIANDYGWSEVFSRQVEALARPGDVLVVLTTSGKSANITAALAAAWREKAALVALTGPAGATVDRYGDGVLKEIRSKASGTPAIQEEHQRWVHEIARRVEEALCPK